MKTKPKTRKEKIQLLKNLQTGKIGLCSLQPHRVECWKNYEGEPDTYTSEHTGEVLTETAFEQRINNSSKNVCYVIQELPGKKKPMSR
jgi:hypothetical protein